MVTFEQKINQMERQKIETAIEILTETQTELNQLFEKNPAMMLRLNHVFSSLISNFRHTINQNINQTSENMERKPLESVFGKSILPKQTQNKPAPIAAKATGEAAKEPDQNEAVANEISAVEKFRAEINEIIPTLGSRKPEEILESVGELHLRGVAKVIGIEDYEESKVDNAFVETIQAKLAEIEEEKKQQEANKEESINESAAADDQPDESADENAAKATGEADEEFEKLAAQYKEIYGRNPNRTWPIETILKKIEEGIKAAG